MTPKEPAALGPVTKREIYAWAMYDWANSAYTSISITALMYYITAVVVGPETRFAAHLSELVKGFGRAVPPADWGDTAFSWGIAIGTLVAAVLSPIAGAMADARANKRVWLTATAMGGSLCAIAIPFVPIDWGWTIIALFILNTLFFEMSFGFYNGFLPELSTEETADRVSALGFSFGYVGGGIALGLVFLVFKFGEQWGLPNVADQLRAGLVIMGLWWGVFSLPALFLLKDRTPARAPNQTLLRTASFGVTEVVKTLRNIRAYRMLALFLLGYLFFNDGIQTVVSQSSVFAKREINFEPAELMPLILAFQFICLPGALIVGYVTEWLGQKRTLMICLGIWVALLGAAYFVTTKAQFWGLTLVLGVVMGGSQSVARAMMSLMTPKHRTAEFFGFFNFSGRATAWIGTFLFGLVINQTGSARLAVLSLLILFAIGWGVTAFVNVAQGQKEAAA